MVKRLWDCVERSPARISQRSRADTGNERAIRWPIALMLPCANRLALALTAAASALTDVSEHRTTADALPHTARGPAAGSQRARRWNRTSVASR
jgi:hypothetical protein